jgi:hypothetical protein
LEGGRSLTMPGIPRRISHAKDEGLGTVFGPHVGGVEGGCVPDGFVEDLGQFNRVPSAGC